MNQQNPPSYRPFERDVPASDDRLGLKPLAKQLAGAVLAHFPDYPSSGPTKSFVIGIEGKWGEGKSTFLGFFQQEVQIERRIPRGLREKLIVSIDKVCNYFYDLRMRSDLPAPVGIREKIKLFRDRIFNVFGIIVFSFVDLDFIHEWNEKKIPHKLAVINFDPWWFAGKDKLLEHFLEELKGSDSAKLLGIRSILSALQKTLVEKKETFIEKIVAISNSVLVPAISFFLIGTVATTGLDFNEIIKSEYWTVILPLAATLFFTMLNLFLSYVGKLFSAPTTFEEKRKILEKKLVDEGKRIVVIIDNIDRLAADEIEELFRVVKSVIDLSNIVYVLAYDRAVVASALDKAHPRNGNSYLEKIVQLPYRLPKPSRSQFAHYVNGMMLSLPMLQRGDILHRRMTEEDRRRLNLLSILIKTPRDAIRLKNALLVSYGNDIADEIHPIDFILMQACELFVPDVANELTSLKNLADFNLFSDASKDTAELIDAWFKANYPSSIRWLEENHERYELMALLSSQAFNHVDGSVEYEILRREVVAKNGDSKWRNFNRITEPKVIIQYLQRALSPGEASRKIVEGLSYANEKTNFIEICNGIHASVLEDCLSQLYFRLNVAQQQNEPLNFQVILEGLGECETNMLEKTQWGKKNDAIKSSLTRVVNFLFANLTFTMSSDIAKKMLINGQLIYSMMEVLNNEEIDVFGTEKEEIKGNIIHALHQQPIDRLLISVGSQYEISLWLQVFDPSNLGNWLQHRCMETDFFTKLCLEYAAHLRNAATTPIPPDHDFLSKMPWFLDQIQSTRNEENAFKDNLKEALILVERHLLQPDPAQ